MGCHYFHTSETIDYVEKEQGRKPYRRESQPSASQGRHQQFPHHTSDRLNYYSIIYDRHQTHMENYICHQ
jgi:hypothetical protein